MKEKRCYCVASTTVGNRIYILGGQDDDYNDHFSCEVFDTSTNIWSYNIPGMNKERIGCQAVSIGTNSYAMGGSRSS